MPRAIDLVLGQHKIALKYEVVVEGDNPHIEAFISSAPIVITFTIKKGKSYQLVPHPSIKSFAA